MNNLTAHNRDAAAAPTANSAGLIAVKNLDADLLAELQCHGVRWQGADGLSRKGGAGPSDHKALTLGEHTAMVPMLNRASLDSPYSAIPDANGAQAAIFREGLQVGEVLLPGVPKFYALNTEDGVPYWKIATLHSKDVLATTIVQHERRRHLLPVLRHWPIPGQRQDHRPQAPGATGSGGQGSGGT
jgi:hypothetical protein